MSNRKPGRLRDRMMLLGAALLFIAVGMSAFLLADKFHISSDWVLLGFVSLGFFAGAGWGFRAEFKSIAFVIFFAVWMCIHAAVFAFVIGRFGWAYWFSALFVELCVFYATAYWFFGLMPPLKRDR